MPTSRRIQSRRPTPLPSIAPEDATLLSRQPAHLRQRSLTDFAQAMTARTSQHPRHMARAPRHTSIPPARARLRHTSTPVTDLGLSRCPGVWRSLLKYLRGLGTAPPGVKKKPEVDVLLERFPSLAAHVVAARGDRGRRRYRGTPQTQRTASVPHAHLSLIHISEPTRPY